jgi:hypothetical protein
MKSGAWEGQVTTMQDIPVNVHVIARTPEEMAGLLYTLQKRVAALESIVRDHLVLSRRILLQEVGWLEEALEVEPTTKELRDKAYNDRIKKQNAGLDKG